MACCPDRSSILGELKDLVNQIGCCDKKCPSPPPQPCCQEPCCSPVCFPFAQVTMTCPPPILAPTRPEPVKPLQLPCPYPQQGPPELTAEEAERSRIDNFYNNYNIDWHNDSPTCKEPRRGQCTGDKARGATVDGKSPCCEDYQKKQQNDNCPLPGCPTGFKPCTMKLTPPPCCDPCGIWCAQVQPCPPKPKKKRSNVYEPGPCTRPCCKHWEPKEGPCLYDDPCKADCFNHPPGMKPSGRFP